MTVRSFCAVAPVVDLTTSFVTYYTVPGGMTLIVRSMGVNNVGSSSATLAQVTMGASQANMIATFRPAANDVDLDDVWRAFGPGVTIRARDYNGTGSMRFFLYGALLDGYVA